MENQVKEIATPDAVVAMLDTSRTNKHFLKTVKGGWIETRLMTYGEKSVKTDKSVSITRTITSDRNQDDKVWMEQLSHQANIIDIQTCIVNHNLTALDGIKLDFSNPRSIDCLHPKIGEEINAIIDEENNLNEEDLKDE